MEFRILGPLEVQAVGGEEITIPAGRQRELLVRLLLAPDEVISPERLADDLGANSSTSGRGTSTIRTYVARLRTSIDSEVLATRNGGYVIDSRQARIDSVQFQSLLDDAQNVLPTDPSRAASLVRDALGLWRGPALPEVADTVWAQPTIVRLHEQRLEAFELRLTADLGTGNHRGVLPELAELTRKNPLRERFWELRMLALYRAGRQAEALETFRLAARILEEEAGLEPGSALRELQTRILAQDETLAPVGGAARAVTVAASSDGARTLGLPAHLPATVPVTNIRLGRGRFIGRDAQLRELTAAIADDRLITIVGVGGVGKSRLAAQAASAVLDERPDGVWSIDLSVVVDPEGLVAAITSTLNVPRRDGHSSAELLTDYLRTRDCLLVFDNCEHLIDATAKLVGVLVDECPSVTAIVTSREPLMVAGERLLPLPPMPLPAVGATPEELASNEAVALFAARAAAVSRGFRVTERNASAVTQVCRRLDGIPLALELAAARLRMMSPEDLASRLGQRFQLLAGGRRSLGRHDTLRQAVDWSYDLLEPEEQRALRMLSVAVGAFDLDTAVALITPDSPDERRVIDLVGRLFDKSLLVIDRDESTVRYRMLETIRQYATDRLEDAAELTAARNVHADHVLQLVERAGRLLRGPQERQAVALLDASLGDIRGAYEWCLAAERWADAAMLVVQMRWERVGRRIEQEVTHWASLLWQAEPDLPAGLRARIQAIAALDRWLAGDLEAGTHLARRGIAAARDLDEETRVDVGLASAWVLWGAGDIEATAEAFLPLADPTIGDRLPADVAAFALAGIAMGMVEGGFVGEDDAAANALIRTMTDRAADLADKSGTPSCRAFAHYARAVCFVDYGAPDVREELTKAAAIDGTASPVWRWHARAHLAFVRSLDGDTDGLAGEGEEILRGALSSVDEVHLQWIASLVGGALVLAEIQRPAAALVPLLRELIAVPRQGWRQNLLTLADDLDSDVVRAVDAETAGMDAAARAAWAADELAKAPV